MKQLFENPVLTGALGLMVSGALMYLLRSLPARLFDIFWKRIVAEITIPNTSPAFHWAEEWLIAQPYAKKTKRLMISQSAEDGRQLILAPGHGRHLFFDGFRPIWFTRDSLVKESGSRGHGPSEAITIGTIDLGRKTIEKIYEQIRDSAESRRTLRVFTCSSWGYWTLLLKREHRALESVYVKSDLKEKILGHIKWYLASKQWFTDHGIPYRTGILLYGPPGTGKTSLVHAIAGAFDLSVYMLNPSDLDSENALRHAMATVERRAILLIEDADASIAPRPQVTEMAKPMTPAASLADAVLAPKEERKGPSLSAVLNALDGIAAADGRILIMTTNYKERLDSALIRDGRVDLRVEIGQLERGEALQMARSFFPEREDLEELVDRNGPKTGAEWQTFFAEMSKPTYHENGVW